MKFVKEELNPPVDYKTLEEALIKAAKEIGLKLKKRKEKVYENNGCTQTTFYFGKRMSRAMEVVAQDHGRPISFLNVYAYGIAPKKRIKTYLERVHDYL